MMRTLLIGIMLLAGLVQAQTPQELEAFFAAFFTETLDRHELPGAVVTLVKDGEVLFAKGYGHADVQARVPFDPETVLRAGSVSKLVTATAVMQLVERGLLDFHTDVNLYLDGFKIPPSYLEPITLAHLLTHTAGFDERLLNVAVQRAEALVPLSEHVKKVPPRVRPPGELISYSNYGYSLAGYIVEAVSGVPFADYLEENVFKPLGMDRSSFAEPIGARALGYRASGDGFEPVAHLYIQDAPAGSLYSTAADMAEFMMAQLEPERLLGETTLQAMHRQAFTHHPSLPGWTLGFHEGFYNGRRILGHGGDLPGFHSLLVLVPEERLGLFVSFNGEPRSMSLSEDPRDALVARFFDRYFPAPAPPVIVSSSQESARVTGTYRWTRYSRTSAEKLLYPSSLMEFHVRASGDGAINLSSSAGLFEASNWLEVSPLVFRNVESGDYLVFREDERGNITHMFTTIIVPFAFERVPRYETAPVLLGLLAFSLLGFLSVVVLWPLAYLRGQRPASHVGVWAIRVALLTSGLGLLVVIVLAVAIAQVMSSLSTPLLPVIGVMPFLFAALALAMLGCSVILWKGGHGSLPSRLHYSLVSLGALAFILQLAHWNLL